MQLIFCRAPATENKDDGQKHEQDDNGSSNYSSNEGNNRHRREFLGSRNIYSSQDNKTGFWRRERKSTSRLLFPSLSLVRSANMGCCYPYPDTLSRLQPTAIRCYYFQIEIFSWSSRDICDILLYSYRRIYYLEQAIEGIYKRVGDFSEVSGIRIISAWSWLDEFIYFIRN